MTRRARAVLATVALAGLAALLAWAATGLPDAGHPSGPNAGAVPRLLSASRSVANAVNGVTFDLRGLDTLGEELILFVAAVGTAVLLRHHREPEAEASAAEHEEQRRPQTAGALRAAGAVLVGPVVVLATYVITHGHLSPGGGFQGGVIAAGALLLVYAAGQVIALARVEPTAMVEATEAIGALAFVLVALGGLVFSGALLANFLPLGTSGSLLSAGTIPVLSVAVGVEVTGATALIFTELLDQALLGRGE